LPIAVEKGKRRLDKDILCSICGRKVRKSALTANTKPDRINGAVIGAYIEVRGHRTCVQNVNEIVIKNRARIESVVKDIKKEISEELGTSRVQEQIFSLFAHMLEPEEPPEA
jgi:hypothetical protein